MLCQKCLKEIPDGSEKCPVCGEQQYINSTSPDKPEYNPLSGPPVDTPTSRLDYAALEQHYKQAVKRPPRNIFFWVTRILLTFAIVCFFMPFISGSLDLFHVSESEKYSGYEYMIEAKDFLKNADSSVPSDEDGMLGALVTLLILSLGFVFMMAALLLRRGYGTLALGTLVVYGLFFIIIKSIGSDESLNHSTKISPGVGLILTMILMVVVFAFGVLDRRKARAVLRENLGIV